MFQSKEKVDFKKIQVLAMTKDLDDGIGIILKNLKDLELIIHTLYTT